MILDMVERLNPSKVALCKKAGITVQTLDNWLRDDEDFAERYAAAVRAHLDGLSVDARKSLKKLIKGYTVTERKTVYIVVEGELVKDKVVETERHIPPSVAAVVFALSNLDPRNFE